MHQVRVRHKGQVTLPTELTRKLKIEEGSILQAEASPEGIILKPLSPVQAGKVIGLEPYQKVIEELDELRKKWR